MDRQKVAQTLILKGNHNKNIFIYNLEKHDRQYPVTHEHNEWGSDSISNEIVKTTKRLLYHDTDSAKAVLSLHLSHRHGEQK